jgi:hypothetical protein
LPVKFQIEHLNPWPRSDLNVFLNYLVDGAPLTHILKARRPVNKIVYGVVRKSFEKESTRIADVLLARQQLLCD